MTHLLFLALYCVIMIVYLLLVHLVTVTLWRGEGVLLMACITGDCSLIRQVYFTDICRIGRYIFACNHAIHWEIFPVMKCHCFILQISSQNSYRFVISRYWSKSKCNSDTRHVPWILCFVEYCNLYLTRGIGVFYQSYFLNCKSTNAHGCVINCCPAGSFLFFHEYRTDIWNCTRVIKKYIHQFYLL